MPGLRDNFNPRARWRSAINSTRALVRLHAGAHAAKLNGANGSIKPEIPSDDDDDDDDSFPLPTSRKSTASTSKLLAVGESGPRLNVPNVREPTPPLPSSNVVQPLMEEDRGKESPGPPPSTQEAPQPEQPRVEQVVEDTSRMSIQTDDLPIPGSYYRKDHVIQDYSGEHNQQIPTWFSRLFRNNRS